MPRRGFDPDAKYQSITGAARLTGLSQGYIRGLCKNNMCPFVMCGQEYRINMALFTQQLEAESTANFKVEVTA